jgi:signal transduction histidine kinase
VDGSREEAPHTEANEADLGCAGKDKTAPQVYVTTIWHLGLGLPWDFRMGPGTDSERRHALDMVNDLPPRALLVADAGFVGYELCRTLLRSSRSFLLRVGSNVRLLEKLGYYRRERSDVVYLWPQKRQGRGRGKPLVLRLIRLRKGKQVVYLLTNVLDNAVKFSPTGGDVRVGVSASGAEALIVVSDRGPGMEASELPHLFGRFHRGAASRAGGVPGFGLGLAISQAAIEHQGGRIEADDGPGPGARVSIRLPLAS